MAPAASRALERVMWPSLHDERVAGDARAVLAKAAVVAREAGVEHESLAVDERPATRSDPAGRRGAWLRPRRHRVARPSRASGVS